MTGKRLFKAALLITPFRNTPLESYFYVTYPHTCTLKPRMKSSKALLKELHPKAEVGQFQKEDLQITVDLLSQECQINTERNTERKYEVT